MAANLATTATTPVQLTCDELIALADVLGRVMAGASGDYGALRQASLAALRPAFATAAGKISAAALATVEAGAMPCASREATLDA